MRQQSVLGLIALLLVAPAAEARLGAFSVNKLAKDSSLIVEATVTDITAMDGQEGKYLVATARVREVLKGAPIATVHFRASPGQVADDSSHAAKGESVLLFLGGETAGVYYISALGRGYMPLRDIDGSQYATYWGEVQMPKGAAVMPSVAPVNGQTSEVPYRYLKDLIARQANAKAEN